MEQQVRVLSVRDDGTAQVVHIRRSACSGDCHECSGCGAAQQAVAFTAVNAIGAKPGQWVLVRSETAPVLKAAAVLYLLPLVLFFAGYILGQSLWQAGTISGGIAFALAVALAVLYDRLAGKKQKTVYTITGHCPQKENGPDERGS